MQYNASTPAEYLDQLPNDWRKAKLLHIRDWIKQHAPEANEFIDYKMLAYGSEQAGLFHLNAQKNYVSLYVGDTTKIDESGALLEGLDCGKGCIRIKKSVDVANTQLELFIKKAIALWKLEVDLGC